MKTMIASIALLLAFEAVAQEAPVWRTGTAGGCVAGCGQFNIQPDDRFSIFVDARSGRVFTNADLTGITPEQEQVLIADFLTRQELFQAVNESTTLIQQQFDNFEGSVFDQTVGSLNQFAQTVNLAFVANRDYADGLAAQAMAAATLTDDDISISVANVSGRNAYAIGSEIDFPSFRWAFINGASVRANVTTVESSSLNSSDTNFAGAVGFNFGPKLY